MKYIIIALLMATGCDRFTTKAMDDRHFVMDCEMSTPEGAVMKCKHDLSKEVAEEGDQINVKHPASM